jgi:hypothetical protein
MENADVTDTAQVSRIKERVEEKEGIPPAQQRLIYGGKQMCVFTSFCLPVENKRARRRKLQDEMGKGQRLTCCAGLTTRRLPITNSRAARRCIWCLRCVAGADYEAVAETATATATGKRCGAQERYGTRGEKREGESRLAGAWCQGEQDDGVGRHDDDVRE